MIKFFLFATPFLLVFSFVNVYNGNMEILGFL